MFPIEEISAHNKWIFGEGGASEVILSFFMCGSVFRFPREHKPRLLMSNIGSCKG